VTRFAACFLLVFGELAFGGTFALSIPPFFKVERGFYKSTAGVYLSAALVTAVGFALLAIRGAASHWPSPAALWAAAALWSAFSVADAVYLVTLWREDGWLRAKSYTAALALGLIAVVANAILLKPAEFGAVAALFYGLTAVTSALVLGLVSGAMMFGHWYLIDPNLPVDYLRSFVRILGGVLIIDVAALGLSLAVLAMAGGPAGVAVANLIESHGVLLASRTVLGPVATLILTWMTWQTLKVPQTMAATGLLYIAVMAALVGEMLGRFILFRTAVPF
jgi:hypothetical protein